MIGVIEIVEWGDGEWWGEMWWGEFEEFGRGEGGYVGLSKKVFRKMTIFWEKLIDHQTELYCKMIKKAVFALLAGQRQ